MRILAIAVVVVVIGLAAWFAAFLRLNRQRGQGFLDRLRLSWHGRVLGQRWHGALLHAGIQFRSHSLRTAHVTFRLLPRPIPWKWLLSWWRAEPETLRIESDLESPPAFTLAVRNHRWSGRVGNAKYVQHGWNVSRPGPILLTTEEQWECEKNPVMNALLAARHSELTEIRLQPQSPHLIAELPLEALEDLCTASRLLDTLQELAAGARAQKH